MLGALAAAVLYLGHGLGAAVAILMLATIGGCMNGINLLFVSILPTYFKKHGNISTVTGVLNSTTYVGSALSTYGIAFVSVHFGWSASALVWLILGTVSTALCLVNAPKWEKTYMTERQDYSERR